MQLEQLQVSEMITEEQLAKLETLRGNEVQLEGGISQYQQGIEEAQTNLAKLPYAPAKISGANEVIANVLINILGVPSMDYVNDETIGMFNDKMNQLVNGIVSLHQASSALTNGLEELHNGTSLLVDGSKQLSSGTTELAQGIEKLNNEGIHKLTEYGNKITNAKLLKV